MHDIRLIRDDPEAFDAAMKRRGLEAQAARLLELDRQHRENETNAQTYKAWRNKKSAEYGKAKAKADPLAEQIYAEIKAADERAPDFEKSGQSRYDALAALPNRPAEDVPEGADEAGNVEQKAWGTKRQFNYAPANHADLGPALGLDFETGALISGTRFTFLRGQMARLQRALGQFMLDRQTAAGFIECAPPLLVREEAMFGTGQLPKFAEDSFRSGDHWLIPTSEVSLTNSIREQILVDAVLPIKMTAITPCFRSEAGSAGKDTRGYIRQHQFEKVELVTICRPEDSAAEHETMTLAAEAILEALVLP